MVRTVYQTNRAVLPCLDAAMSSLMSSMSVSNTSCRRLKDEAVRTMTTGKSSMASSGSSGQGHPGGICLSGTATGKQSMIGSGAGPKMAPLSRLYGTSRASSTLKAASTGLSSTWTAPLSRPLGPPLAGPTMIKKGPNRARRGCRPSPRIWPRRVLHQDPSAHRSARPSAGSSPVGGSASRVSLLRRSGERGIGPSASRTTAEAPRSGPRAIGPTMPPGSAAGLPTEVSSRQFRSAKTSERALDAHQPATNRSIATEIRSSAALDTSRSAAAW